LAAIRKTRDGRGKVVFLCRESSSLPDPKHHGTKKTTGPRSTQLLIPGPRTLMSTNLTLTGDWQNATAGDELERHALF
jgi:hypothetical protein